MCSLWFVSITRCVIAFRSFCAFLVCYSILLCRIVQRSSIYTVKDLDGIITHNKCTCMQGIMIMCSLCGWWLFWQLPKGFDNNIQIIWYCDILHICLLLWDLTNISISWNEMFLDKWILLTLGHFICLFVILLYSRKVVHVSPKCTKIHW